MPDLHFFTVDPGLDELAIAHWTVPGRHGMTGQDLVRGHLSSMTMTKTKPEHRTSRRLAQLADYTITWTSERIASKEIKPGRVYAVIELPARGGIYGAKEDAGVPLEAVMRRMQAQMAASGAISAAFDRLGIEVWYWVATGRKEQRKELALLALKGAKANSWAGRSYPPDLLDAVAQGLQVMSYFVDLAQGRPLPGVGSILGRAAKSVPGYGGPKPLQRTRTKRTP